ncbi:Rad1-domain-containing protein [Serendipita vermifera]|nr:Rad1-domain-containing protein [Serendipita vermifera]
MPSQPTQTEQSQTQSDKAEKDESELILSTTLRDVSPFIALLKAISPLSNTASLIFSRAGIQIEVEYRRALQATAYLATNLFDEWHYEPPKEDQEDEEEAEDANVEIDINLKILNEALSIYGSTGASYSGKRKWTGREYREDDEEDPRGPLDRWFHSRNKPITTMRMSYAGVGHPLSLFLAEKGEGPSTVCHITTLLSERRMEIGFNDADKIVKIIMKSVWLRDALSEIDTSCEFITIICNPPQKITRTADNPRLGDISHSFFRIEAKSMRGNVEMDFPNDREVLEVFECGESVKFNYTFDVMRQIVRALSVSMRVSIRIDGEGVMSLQFLMPSGPSGERTTWMEYRVKLVQHYLTGIR